MLIMGHAAITDVGGNSHVFSEVLYRAAALLGGFGAEGDTMVAWSRGPPGTEERWTLRWRDGAFAFTMADRRRGIALELTTGAGKPLVFQGPNGYSLKSPAAGSASLYYSLTRVPTSGTVQIGGRSYAVTGTSWMDKEFGSNQLGRDQVGWDWFSLQLDDGRELMLYLLRDSTGATNFASATVVGRDGATRYLGAGDFTVENTAQWTSDSTRATYPARWTVSVPSERLELTVTPFVADQENRSEFLRRLFYWEGAVGISDNANRPVGRGYVELVGYGKGLRPAL
jgi:predicted secreted hydrolase